MLPNFLIVGAAKSGTTSLHYYLQEHPEIFMPKERKELRFFSSMRVDYRGVGDESINESIIRSLDEYKSFFEKSGGKRLIGESSPDYLFHYKSAIKNIKKYLGDPKIIIILREPVSRAYSHYTMYVRDGRESLSFEEALNMEEKRKNDNWEWGWQYRKAGLYYEQVKSYMDNFSDVKVYLFDELKSNDDFMHDVHSFLGVNNTYDKSDARVIYNVSGLPKSRMLHNLFTKRNLIKSMLKPVFDYVLPQAAKSTLIRKIKNKNLVKRNLNPKTEKMLKEYYHEDIVKLEELICKDLRTWLK